MDMNTPEFEMLRWQASDDIKYEWNQLVACVEIMRSVERNYPNIAAVSEDKVKLYNLALTGFAVHARSLFDFFHEPKNAHADDIFAWHYFEPPASWQPPQIVGKDENWIKHTRQKVHIQAAHLSYGRARLTLEEKRWDRDEILDYLNTVWREFYTKSSEKRFKKLR